MSRNCIPKTTHSAQADANASPFAETRDWFPTAEALAEQLHDNAQRLTAQFPARALTPPDAAAMARRVVALANARPVALPEKTPIFRRRVPLRYVAAAVVLSLGVGSYFADRGGRPTLNEQARHARVAVEPVEFDAGEALLAPQQFQSLSAPNKKRYSI
ncbi:MAG: hypothetical protein QM811_06570 [Pirellulales bacterium]